MSTKDVNGDRGFLSLIFAAGMIAIVLATVMTAVGISASISLLAGHTFSFPQPLAWLFGSLTGFSAYMVVAVAAVVFALAGMWSLGKAKAMIAQSPDFVDTPVYRVIFYSALVVLGVITVASLSAAIAIAIASLVTIGGDVSTGDMYVEEFMPAAVTALVAGVTTFLALGVAKNKPGSISMLSIVLISLAGVALVLAGVAVGIKSHDDKFYSNGASNTVEIDDVKLDAGNRSSALDELETSDTSNSLDALDSESWQDMTNSVQKKCATEIQQYQAGKLTLEQYKTACMEKMGYDY